MIPKYLYHYTSVETLLLILETNSIRFNRLDRMNDPHEGYNSQWTSSKKNVFASSWTSESRDELPMWKIYNDLKGIRLRMPIDLFNFNKNLSLVKTNQLDTYLIKSDLEEKNQIKINYTNFPDFSDKIEFIEIKNVYGPSKVEYFESIDNVKMYDPNEYENDVALLGQRKLDYWDFEKEYRYRIFNGRMIAEKLKSYETFGIIETQFVDIKFKKSALENIEILLGPHTEENHKNTIDQTLRMLGIQNFEIKRSKINIR